MSNPTNRYLILKKSIKNHQQIINLGIKVKTRDPDNEHNCRFKPKSKFPALSEFKTTDQVVIETITHNQNKIH